MDPNGGEGKSKEIIKLSGPNRAGERAGVRGKSRTAIIVVSL
jgi:hypothetical protein